MVTVFKLEYDSHLLSKWLEIVRWQVNYGTSLVYRESLPPTVMEHGHKVKVTKKYVYLSDDNLADDEESIA